MRFLKVERKQLLLIAGLVWTLAGFMVARLGMVALVREHWRWYLILGALMVMLIFYLLIFSHLVYRHERRIRSYAEAYQPFWRFFDLKSYLFVVVMMGGGILARRLGLVPVWFMAFFYTGLGIALFSCGLRFLIRWLSYDQGQHLIARFEKWIDKEEVTLLHVAPDDIKEIKQ